MRLNSSVVIAVAVAVATLLTALSEGGYGPRFTAGAGLVAWWAVVVTVVARPRSPHEVPLAGRAAFLFLLAWAAWALASAIWAPDPGQAVTDAARLLTYAGAFCLVVLHARRGSMQAWMGGLLAGLIVVAGVACAVRFFPGLAADRDAFAAALPGAQGRLGYPIGYWNALGACMAVMIVALSAFGAYARVGIVRWGCVALVPIPALVIYLASSRASAAAAGLGILTLAVFSAERSRILAGLAIAAPGALLVTAYAADQPMLLQGVDTTASRDQGLALFGVTVAAVALTMLARFLLEDRVATLRLPRPDRRYAIAAIAIAIIVAAAAADPQRRWSEFRDPPDFAGPGGTFATRHIQSFNGNGRYQFWSAATDAFADAPLAGQGAGGYEPYWYRNGDLDYRLRDAHSTLFETAAELGAVGLVAMGGFFGIVGVTGIRRASRARRRGDDAPEAVPLAIFATGVAAVFVDWSWEVPATALPILLGAALLTTAAGVPLRSPPDGRKRLGSAALVVAACLSAAVLGHQLLVQNHLERSRDLAATGNLDSAGDAARRAEALEPWSPAPFLQQALIAEQLGDPVGARREILQAIERSPADWQLWIVAARLELEAGDADAAVASLRRARELSPRSAILLPRPPPPGLIPRDGS